MLLLFNILLFLILASPSFAGLPPTRILDEGTDKGVAFKFDCVGAGIVCSQSGVTGTLTVGTGAGGDSVSIDGVSVTDPNFNSTGDVDFVDTANVVTGTVVSVRPAAENSIEALLDLQDLQGAVTDAQVPNTITIDLATTATTANAGDSATSFFSSGTLEVAIGGTGTTTSTGTGAVVLGTSPTFTTDIVFPALAVEAGALAAASVDGDDINSNLAGRSLTLTAASPDTLDADVELYTIRLNAGLENPVAADNDIIQIEPAGAFTITEIACSTDTGTATINFNENVNTTPNTAGTAILSADIVCDTGRQSSCASGCDVNTISNGGITAGNLISMITTSVASAPTKLRIHIKGTYDD